MTSYKTAQDLAARTKHEFMLVCGQSNSGKTRAILDTADYWELEHEDAIFYIVDTEAGFEKLIEEDYAHLQNLRVYEVRDAEETIDAIAELASTKLGADDWIVFESLGTNWEDAQTMAIRRLIGPEMSKDKSVSQWIAHTGGRMKSGEEGPVPQPDMLWTIAKDAHVRNVVKVLQNIHRDGHHVLCTTTVPPEARKQNGDRRKVSESRKKIAEYLNSTISPDGAPNNPRLFDTVVLLEYDKDGFWAQRLKDRGHKLDYEKFTVQSFYRDLLAERAKEREEQ